MSEKFPFTIDKYKINKLIGEGTYGKVYLAVDDTGLIVAIKKTTIWKTTGISDLIEIDVLSRIQHPNVLKSYDIFFDEENSYVVSPIAEFDLSEIPSLYLDYKQKLRLCYELVEGMICLHHTHIYHCDLKPGNLLLFVDPDEEYTLRIADFGLSGYLHPSLNYSNILCQTRTYAPPELLNDEPYDVITLDIWVVGLMLYFILQRKLPYNNNLIDYKNWLKEYGKNQELFWFHQRKSLGDDWVDLLSRMLKVDRERRIQTMDEVIHSPIFIKAGYSIINYGTVKPVLSFNLETNISKKGLNMIKILTNWLNEIAKQWKLPAAVMFLTFDILYRILTHYPPNAHTLQLYGCTCLFIASKLLLNLLPGKLNIDLFCKVSDQAFTVDQVISLEKKIITEMDGVLYTNVLFDKVPSLAILKETIGALLDYEAYINANLDQYVGILIMQETALARSARKSKYVLYSSLFV